jgi:hypothetical protein
VKRDVFRAMGWVTRTSVDHIENCIQSLRNDKAFLLALDNSDEVQQVLIAGDININQALIISQLDEFTRTFFDNSLTIAEK